MILVGITFIVSYFADTLANSGAFIPTHPDYQTYLTLERLKQVFGLPIMPVIILAVASGIGRLVFRPLSERRLIQKARKETPHAET